MNTWERLRLNAFQKWKKYGLPPWKFILNMLLIVCTTLVIYMLSSSITPYTRGQKQNWESTLVPPEFDFTGYGYPYTYFIYTVDDIMSAIQQMNTVYFTLPTAVVGSYEYIYENDGTLKPMQMTVSKYKYPDDIFNPDINTFNNERETETYTIRNASYLGPFSNTSGVNNLVHSLISVQMTFHVRNTIINNGKKACWVNEVNEKYQFYYRGRIQLRVDPEVAMCNSEFHTSLFNRDYFWTTIALEITAVLSIIALFLHLKNLHMQIMIYRKVKNRNRNLPEWRDMSWSDRMEFFNVWFFIATIGNSCNIIGSLWCDRYFLYDTSDDAVDWDSPLFFIGVGCLFTWTSILQYLESFPQYYFLILTLKKSSPRVLAFLVGVLPVFLGFACFGVVYFSPGSELFSSVDQASVTLFALLNGDVIHDVFDDIYDQSPFLSRLYLYIFISLFIYAVLNIFIAIVEDAFFASKQEADKELKEDLEERKKPPQQLDVITLLQGPPVPSMNSPTITAIGTPRFSYPPPSKPKLSHDVTSFDSDHAKNRFSLFGWVSKLKGKDGKVSPPTAPKLKQKYTEKLLSATHPISITPQPITTKRIFKPVVKPTHPTIQTEETEDVLPDALNAADLHKASSGHSVDDSVISSVIKGSHKGTSDGSIFSTPQPKSTALQTKSLSQMSNLLRSSRLSRSDLFLLRATYGNDNDSDDDDINATNVNSAAAQQKRRQLTEQFLITVAHMLESYNAQFMNSIEKILTTAESGNGSTMTATSPNCTSIGIRPPHSAANYPCSFHDCIYCHLRGILESNLSMLRNRCRNAVVKAINNQTRQ